MPPRPQQRHLPDHWIAPRGAMTSDGTGDLFDDPCGRPYPAVAASSKSGETK